MAESTYWATEKTPNIVNACSEKIEQYFRFLQQSGRLELYRRSYRTYYAPGILGGTVNFTGQQGELVQISVNDYRALLKHLHTLTTSERPSFQCRASNTDHKSMAQTILGQGLVDYYLREKDLETYLKNAVEIALIYGEGFISVIWNPTMGEEYGADPETGAVIYQGDIAYKCYSPMELVRDFTKPSPLYHDWNLTIDWQNKYELAAKNENQAEQIVKLTDETYLFDGIDTLRESRRTMYSAFDTDDIPIFNFYHKPSAALPNGRLVTFLCEEILLFDGPAPYRDVPVYRVSAGEWLGTPFGYTVGYDLMPPQQMTDALHSTTCTNENAFGVQNIWAQKGDVPDVSSIAGGMNLFLSQTKPEALQLTQTPAEIFTYMEILDGKKAQLSGINEVVQGAPKGDMSGSAMALLTAQAIKFSMDLQMSYTKLFEACGTATLERLRVFGNVPRVAAIVGKANKQYMREFIGDDIAEVNRVLVDQGNPILNTMAGKANLADQLLKTGLITTPEQYITVITTGRVEPLYENLQSELMLIRQENELLNEGQNPAVLATDNPLLHIKEHATVANSPEARTNPAIMQAYTMHLQQHIDVWRTLDPDLANMLGIPAPPPLLSGAPAGVPGGLPSGEGQMPQGGTKEIAESSKVGPDAVQAAKKVKQPNLPSLPPGTPPQYQEAAQSSGMVQ